jgi:hypothetical protein
MLTGFGCRNWYAVGLENALESRHRGKASKIYGRSGPIEDYGFKVFV